MPNFESSSSILQIVYSRSYLLHVTGSHNRAFVTCMQIVYIYMCNPVLYMGECIALWDKPIIRMYVNLTNEVLYRVSNHIQDVTTWLSHACYQLWYIPHDYNTRTSRMPLSWDACHSQQWCSQVNQSHEIEHGHTRHQDIEHSVTTWKQHITNMHIYRLKQITKNEESFSF